MTKLYRLQISLFILVSTLLSGCASKPNVPPTENIPVHSAEQRTKQLLGTKAWRLRGKIAFIQKISSNNKKDTRESAAIAWQVNEQNQTQELNLTSYFGINVLHLKSKQNQHVIKVDGKEYHTTDLPQLIHSLTGLTLPIEALTYWLKGLPYNPSDKLKTDDKTQLPISIASYYHNDLWQITYHNYQNFDGFNMATKFTLKKEGLLIKVAVKEWSFND